MGRKGRVLHLMQYLQENSDEGRTVTTAQARKALAEKGYPTGQMNFPPNLGVK